MKVIIETCYLTKEEKIASVVISKLANVDFVKTSTGFGTDGAKAEDVALMKFVAGPNIKVKASGGIRDLETAMKMINAGADRIGTSSGVNIVKNKKERINAPFCLYLGFSDYGRYYKGLTLEACGPLSPLTTSNSTSWSSSNFLYPSI